MGTPNLQSCTDTYYVFLKHPYVRKLLHNYFLVMYFPNTYINCSLKLLLIRWTKIAIRLARRINVVTKSLKKCLNAYNTGFDSSCHLSWEEAVNLSSQIYVDCLYSESIIPNSVKYQALQFFKQILRAEEEIVRIKDEMLNCVHHYIGAYECLVTQI